MLAGLPAAAGSIADRIASSAAPGVGGARRRRQRADGGVQLAPPLEVEAFDREGGAPRVELRPPARGRLRTERCTREMIGGT